MKTHNAPLLPSGLYDLLPPEAHMERQITERLLACFESFGYAQVSPPLLEFETSLFSGRGEALASQTFRVMDPLSQKMMGFRADITLQVARIASTRMASAARPLRLCYAGRILQMRGDSLKTDRQRLQAGIELIGTESPHADAEAMIIAAESLIALGIKDISIDINLPGLLAELCPEAQQNDTLRQQVKDAVQRRDAASIRSLPLKNAALLTSLIEAAGTAKTTMARLEKIGITQVKLLSSVVAQVEAACPEVLLTIDPLEYRGFDYHQGIGFSIFAKALRHELGRGGRYRTETDSATGFTLYTTDLLQLIKPDSDKKRILVPQDIPATEARRLRADGWATVFAITKDLKTEAGAVNASALWQSKIVNL